MGPCEKSTMSFVNPEDFQHILRVQNTNIDGNIKVTHALTAIRGMGRRFTDVVLKKAEIDRCKRAGQLSEAEMEQIQTVMANPKNFKIPVWFLNRQRDWKDGKDGQMTSNNLDNKLREDIDRMKKIRLHRGIRHWWVTQSKVKRPRPQDDTVEPAELSERSRFNLVHKFNTFFCSIQFFYIDCSVQKYLLPVRHG